MKKLEDKNLEVLSLTSVLHSLITREWETIDMLNSNIAFFTDQGNEAAVEILSDAINDSYIHVGQFEKLIENNNPAAEQIQDGKEEAESTIKETGETDEAETDVEVEFSDEDEDELEEVEVEEESDEIDDSEIPPDDVPEELADRIKFKKKVSVEDNGES